MALPEGREWNERGDKCHCTQRSQELCQGGLACLREVLPPS